MQGGRYDLTYAICLTVALICVVIGLVANASMFSTVHEMNGAIKTLAREQDETAHICVQLQNEIDVLNNQYRELQAQVKYGLRDRYKMEE
jgi:peptidoglycan hydrolase CwlO-like protein